jgi:hypothetical protein|tara:strand:+ start:1480 stop:1830 length:351 start_codon:yes stop_codon:yes gene_type:complete
MDKRLQDISDDLIDLAFNKDLDLIVEEADFSDDEIEKRGKVVLVCNGRTGDIGCVSTDVTEYPEQQVSFFILELNQYNYFIAEGFETEDIINDMDGKVFKNVSKEEFYKRILTYGD